MIEDVTTALQAFASTGNGFSLTLRDARFLTFKVQGNGNVTAGAVTLECCLQNTPISSGVRVSGGQKSAGRKSQRSVAIAGAKQKAATR